MDQRITTMIYILAMTNEISKLITIVAVCEIAFYCICTEYSCNSSRVMEHSMVGVLGVTTALYGGCTRGNHSTLWWVY